MTVVDFQDLPLADRDREWDGDAANKRVRQWADAQDEPTDRYRRSYLRSQLLAKPADPAARE